MNLRTAPTAAFQLLETSKVGKNLLRLFITGTIASGVESSEVTPRHPSQESLNPLVSPEPTPGRTFKHDVNTKVDSKLENPAGGVDNTLSVVRFAAERRSGPYGP